MGKLSKIIFGVAIFLLAWTLIGVAYNHVYYEPGVYDCSDMSRRHLKTFRHLGISGKLVHGANVEDVTIIYDNDSMDVAGYNGEGHMWIELDILGFKIPWESTFLLPISPTWIGDYDVVCYDGDMDGKLMERYGKK